MRPLAADYDQPEVLPLSDEEERPRVVEIVTLGSLLEQAGVLSRVSGPDPEVRLISSGGCCYWSSEGYYVSLPARHDGRPRRTRAMRVLEILAYVFNDWATRECVCGRNYFRAPGIMGRPRLGDEVMSSAERMRKMREKKRTSK